VDDESQVFKNHYTYYWIINNASVKEVMILAHAETAKTLSFVGQILAFIGAFALFTIATLHFLGIWTPWQNMTIIGPFGHGDVVLPLIVGIVGILFTLLARRQAGNIDTKPKTAGVDLIILGIIVGICTFGLGGLLILIGGIFSILHWSDVRDV
jgi:hypothetical protein